MITPLQLAGLKPVASFGYSDLVTDARFAETAEYAELVMQIAAKYEAEADERRLQQEAAGQAHLDGLPDLFETGPEALRSVLLAALRRRGPLALAQGRLCDSGRRGRGGRGRQLKSP